MLCGLIRNYVHAINQGAVPNIETAWTYICKSQCQKIFEESLKNYEEGIGQKLMDNFPLNEDILKDIHRELKLKCIEIFRKQAMGDFIDMYIQELNNKIKDRYMSVKLENKREFEKLLLQSMNNYYIKVDNRLKSNEIRSYFEFEKEMRNLRSVFMDLDPQGPNKEQLINDFMLKKSNETAHFLIKNSSAELENEINILKDNKDKMERELFDIKEIGMKEKNELSLKLFEVDNAKQDLVMKKQLLEDRVIEMKEEKQTIEENLTGKIENDKIHVRKEIGDCRNKIQELEENKRQLTKDLILARSENEKEIALLKQKVDFYDNQHESWQKKERSLNEEVSLSKKSITQQVKELTNRYENQVSKLQMELDLAAEKNTELQGEMDKLVYNNNIIIRNLDEKLKDALEQKQTAPSESSGTKIEFNLQDLDEMDLMEHPIFETMKFELEGKIKVIENELKGKDDEIKNTKINAKKEIAI